MYKHKRQNTTKVVVISELFNQLNLSRSIKMKYVKHNATISVNAIIQAFNSIRFSPTSNIEDVLTTFVFIQQRLLLYKPIVAFQKVYSCNVVDVVAT